MPRSSGIVIISDAPGMADQLYPNNASYLLYNICLLLTTLEFREVLSMQ